MSNWSRSTRLLYCPPKKISVGESPLGPVPSFGLFVSMKYPPSTQPVTLKLLFASHWPNEQLLKRNMTGVRVVPTGADAGAAAGAVVSSRSWGFTDCVPPADKLTG